MYLRQKKTDIVSSLLTFCENRLKMRERTVEGECNMKFQNNKRAWILFALTLILTVPAYFMLGENTEILVFPAIQAAILILGSSESVKTWFMNYKISVMHSEHQYYFILFLVVLLMLLVGIGYFYNQYIDLNAIHVSDS